MSDTISNFVENQPKGWLRDQPLGELHGNAPDDVIYASGAPAGAVTKKESKTQSASDSHTLKDKLMR